MNFNEIRFADCLLNEMYISSNNNIIKLNFAEIYDIKSENFIENVVIEISNWDNFYGMGFKADKPFSNLGKYYDINWENIELFDSVLESYLFNNILRLKGFSKVSHDWLAYSFNSPEIKIHIR